MTVVRSSRALATSLRKKFVSGVFISCCGCDFIVGGWGRGGGGAAVIFACFLFYTRYVCVFVFFDSGRTFRL